MTIHKRRLVREKVLQVLYAYEISKEPIALLMNDLLHELKSDKKDLEFAQQLIQNVIQHQEHLDQIVKAKVAHWEFERIALIDRLLLCIGICEMLYFPDIPPKVTINEAIEIAKSYSTEKSGKFINGVLDAILDELKSTKSLHKSGRGLLSESPSHETKGSIKTTENS